MNKIKIFARISFLLVSLASVIALAYTPDSYAADVSSRQQGLIEGALSYHPHLKIDQLQVEVVKGRAQLQGVVDSALSKALAQELAASVKGIRAVSNQLRIAERYFSDREPLIETASDSGKAERLSNVTISNKVRSQLLANRVTSGMDVEVDTRNRVVTIHGKVQSEAERVLTYWIVKNTQGVRSVINNLDVRSAHEQQAFVQLDAQ